MSEDLAKTESATSLAKRIRAKEISPVEVVDAAIKRIETHNPKINALVIFGYEDARKAAKAAEAPVMVGKTNSPVFGFRGTCDNYLFGPSKNPFDLTKNTGGSSGGAAGAVAAGLLPMCEGTDGGGSIRIPASWCGVFGYKPAFGRVPLVTRPDAFGGNVPFIFEGPITRTVEDSALAMTALAGYDSRDPYCIEGKADFMGALKRSIAGKKIAYTRDYGIFPVDRRVIDVTDKAIRAFEEAGAHVEEVKIDIPHSHMTLSDMWCRLIAPKQVAALEGFKREGIDLKRD